MYTYIYGRIDDKKRIITIIREEIVMFAMFRFSSSVVDKCFQTPWTMV